MVSKDMFRFIHIPKTAGTAVMQWLRQYFPHVLYGKCGLDKPSHMHRSAAEFRITDDKQVIYFTVVRHPFARLISYYNYIWSDYKPLTFRQFLETQPRSIGKGWLNGVRVPCPWISQTKYVYDANKCLVDKIMKQEHVEIELQSFFQCRHKLSRVNISTLDNYESYCDPDLMDLCYGLFREDYVNFNYQPWTLKSTVPDIPPQDLLAQWFEIPLAETGSNIYVPTKQIDQEIAD